MTDFVLLQVTDFVLHRRQVTALVELQCYFCAVLFHSLTFQELVRFRESDLNMNLV